ncbi:hypothetical protein RI844_14670 [Thalassotalea fonticola]|uniref:Uncharacterized protein n=1 Tax=Thalassotalea fonticola TaxID=3065649 RepID=A0ABZ0GM26_9GAMM|nr:hypothetical protein RI844_14670 [Colwelliaceae bacterium S1-1]
MFKFVSKILIAPLDWFVSLTAYSIFIWCYAQLVLAPAFLLALLCSISFSFVSIEKAIILLRFSGFFGIIIGLFFAEHIRKKYSVFGFLGYIAGHPEIDGRQQPEKGIVFRNGNLTRRST